MYSCEKTEKLMNDDGGESLSQQFKQQINENRLELEAFQTKGIELVCNSDNPYDEAGAFHDSVMKYFNTIYDIKTLTMDDIMEVMSSKYGMNYETTSAEFFDHVNGIAAELLDENENYNPAYINSIENISDNEKSIINDYFIYMESITDLNSRLLASKSLESYILTTELLDEMEKMRILSMFSIYRYSTSFCDGIGLGSSIGGGVRGAIVDMVDCIGYYDARYGDYPVGTFNDGKDLYAHSAMFSLTAIVLFSII
jgi:hypothetical protein